MSRADRRTIPPPPRLRGLLPAAGSDFYYNSWRFLGANLVVGAGMVLVVLVWVATPLALLLLVPLALPVAGMMRMATVLVRGGHTDFGEVTSVLRSPVRILGLAAAQLLVVGVLVADAVIGASLAGWFGTFLTVSAIYGLAIVWAYASVAWPLLLDPERDGDSIRQRLRLAAIVLLAHPVRVGGVLLLIGLLLGLATVAIAPVLTFALALAWLAIARYVLPVADRLEGRATHVADDDAGA